MTAPRVAALLLAGTAMLALATVQGLAQLPARLPPAPGAAARAQVLSADGVVLNRSYTGRWNVHDRVAPHAVPALLRAAFLAAEDRRFREHAGVDWRARLAAAWQNLRAGRVVRGASTLSEQCVRLLVPRPRTLWSRWLEGFDAMRLERRFGKDALLAFYLDQVPFADRRRGVVQAARHYFDRDLDTLSPREVLTLAVLVRAPSRLDPWRAPGAADRAVERLRERMLADGTLAPGDVGLDVPLALAAPALSLEAPHALRAALARAPRGGARLRTTLDARVQRSAQSLLERRLAALAPRGARHAAALVVDHRDAAIRAWVVASAPGAPATRIDPITTPRQPGSTLKPFVYALALEQGWTAATLIDDAPYAEGVGHGQHAYRNYSRVHYGPVSLRDALGNSLNVPAVKALAHAGARALLARLHAMAFASLDTDAGRYGDGLALGNGEVTLLELAGGYATLASGGRFRPLRLLDAPAATPRQVLDPHASAIVADILADPGARRLEFRTAGVLALPLETAVKTGTSSDHRDAWAVGFDHAHVVAVWFGDLARGPMDRVSGASGPALVLRALFAEVNRGLEGAPLPGRGGLERRTICGDDGAPAGPGCADRREEWFAPGRGPAAPVPLPVPSRERIRQPQAGLRLAMDPRLPHGHQRFRIALAPGPAPLRVSWLVDGTLRAETTRRAWLWPMTPGTHTVQALVHADEGSARATTPVTFHVR
jgi:penicillin-binding protein 1C